jgi:hypothetical protein
LKGAVTVFEVADQNSFDADPDFYFNVDQDPTFHFDTDPRLHCEHQWVKKELLAPGFSQSDPGFKKASYPGSGNATPVVWAILYIPRNVVLTFLFSLLPDYQS